MAERASAGARRQQVNLQAGRDANPAALFAQLQACFAAAAAGRQQTVHLRLGLGELVLHVATPELLARLLPPLAHLRCTPAAAPPFRLTVSIFADTQLPPAPWHKSDYDARGLVEGWNDARWHTILDPTRGILRLLDRATHRGICFFPSSEAAHELGFTTPLLSLVAGFFRDLPLQLVHAGAVGNSRGGVLIAGKGGAGKSTTVAACLAAQKTTGLQMAGDDLVLVELAPAPRVFSLLSTVKLEPEAHLLGLDLAAQPTREHETLPRHRHIFFADPAPQLPLSAILVPAITGRPHSQLLPISPAEALRSLAPSTLQLLPEVGGAAFTKLAALVRVLPCYRLAAGTDLSQLAHCIAALIGGPS